MEETQPVEFDMSFSTNNRINYLLWVCNESMKNEDPLEWFKACKNILKECSVSMKQDELSENRDKMKPIEKALQEYNQYNMSITKGELYNPPREVFDLLYEWELLLRQKLNKMGLLFRQKDTFAL